MFVLGVLVMLLMTWGGQTLGRGPSRIYVLVLPSRVFEMFSSRGSYVYFVWLGVLWYTSLCVSILASSFWAQFSFVD